MTVSASNRPVKQLWSDLLVALGGEEGFLTRGLSEREVLIEILNTFGGSYSKRKIGGRESILVAIVTAAGGSSYPRRGRPELLVELITALGGTPPSPYSSSTEELLAAAVNAADAGGGGGDYEGPLDLVAGAMVAFSQRALSAAMRDTATFTVRRHSDDTEQSFLSDAVSGEISLASVATFVGATFTKTGAVFESATRVALNSSVSVRTDQLVSGTYIHADARVTEIIGATSSFDIVGSVALGDTTVVLADATGVVVGQVVTGANIPDDTYVDDISEAPTIYITRDASATNASETLTFHPTIRIDKQLDLGSDPAVTLTFTPVGSVTRWNDQSGNGDDAVQGTALRQPFLSRTDGGLQWVKPSTTDPDFVFLATGGSLTMASPCTFFVVAKTRFDVGPDYAALWSMKAENVFIGTKILTTGAFSYTDVGFSLEHGDADGDVAGGKTVATSLDDQVHLLDAAWEFGQRSVRLDGASLVVDSIDDVGAPGAITAPMAIGSSDPDSIDYNNFYFGTILELIVYPSILSDPDRLAIRQNIAAYYGLSLP